MRDKPKITFRPGDGREIDMTPYLEDVRVERTTEGVSVSIAFLDEATTDAEEALAVMDWLRDRGPYSAIVGEYEAWYEPEPPALDLGPSLPLAERIVTIDPAAIRRAVRKAVSE